MSQKLDADSRGLTFACLAIIFIFGIAITAPLWHSYWYPSHEMGRYLLRTFEFVRGWQDGHLIPRWAPDFYGGYGAPTFVLFAPGVLVAGGFPTFLGVELATSMKLMIVLYGLVGSIGTFYLVRGETRRLDAALVAAVAFTFVPYRFVDLYMRGDLAEYGALCLIPLVLWLYRELGRAPSHKLARLGFAAACAHAAMILSHTIIGQWATELVSVILVCTLASYFRSDRRRVLVGALAFAGALGLAALYLLPALREMKYLHVEVLTGGYVDPLKHTVPFKEFFKFGYYAFVGDDASDTPSYRVRMPFTIGIPLAAAMAAAILCLVSARRWALLRASLPWWISTAAILLLMGSRKLWLYLPFGQQIQFPWRLLALVAAVGSVAIGTTWAAAIPSSWRWRWGLAAVAIILIAWNGQRFVRIGDNSYPWIPAGEPGMNAKSIYTLMEGTAAGEHVPLSVPMVPDQPRTKLVQAVSGGATASAEQLDGTRYRVAIDAAEKSTVELSVFDFPGWQAVLESGPAKIGRGTSTAGLIQLLVPARGHYVALVAFHDTPIRTASALISLLFLFGLYPAMRLLVGSTGHFVTEDFRAP